MSKRSRAKGILGRVGLVLGVALVAAALAPLVVKAAAVVAVVKVVAAVAKVAYVGVQTAKTALHLADGEYKDAAFSALGAVLVGKGAIAGKAKTGAATVKSGGAANLRPNLTAPKSGSTNVGWKVGQPIDNLTRKGTPPKWSTVRQRYWKNEAFKNSRSYSPDNVARMQKGLAPQRFNPSTGKMESMELHHKIPQRTNSPNIHGQSNLKPVWPDEHKIIDPYRR